MKNEKRMNLDLTMKCEFTFLFAAIITSIWRCGCQKKQTAVLFLAVVWRVDFFLENSCTVEDSLSENKPVLVEQS